MKKRVTLTFMLCVTLIATVFAADTLDTFSGAGVGGAITAAYRAGYQTWDIVRRNFNTLNTIIKTGTGSPEATVTAGVGAIYLQSDGVDGTAFWIKGSGAGNTGWISLASVAGGTGDVVGPSSSVASEVVLFDGTTGKLVKRATGTGFVKVSSGVYQTPSATISLAEMATIATDRLLGRDTAGTGIPEVLTVGGGLEFTGSGGIDIAADGVGYDKLTNLVATRLLGRGSSGGTGDPEPLTLGAGLSLSGTVLSATVVGTGGGDVVGPSSAVDGHLTVFDGVTGKLVKDGGAVPGVTGNLDEGRCTTQTGVPISTADRTAQSTLYFTPSSPTGLAIGTGQIALYNGSSLTSSTFTELSIALSGLTTDKNYDAFIDYNSGTPQIVLSAAWTNSTTRADALATQTGIVVKSGTPAYRFVCTIRTTGTTTTEDSEAKRFVWNAYNQVRRKMKVIETANTWNYTTATFRQANANTANQLAYVTGNAAALVDARVRAMNTNASDTGTAVGIGIDSTSTNSADVYGQDALDRPIGITAEYQGMPGLGYHFLAWLEYSVASGTTTWYGDAGNPTLYQMGITGAISN